MGFGAFAIGRTHQTADGQIETGRTILPLVVTVGDERRNTMGELIVMLHKSDDTVNRRVGRAIR
jgi:hypothetical protein